MEKLLKFCYGIPYTDEHILTFVYTNTLASDRSLKDPLIAYAQKHWEEICEKEDFKTVLAESIDFAVDMIKSKPLTIKEIQNSEPIYSKTCSKCRSTNKWKPSRVTCACGRWEDLYGGIARH